MARKTAKQKKIERRVALGLLAGLSLALLTAVLIASPKFAAWVYERTGVIEQLAPPALDVDSPVKVHVIDVGQGDAVLLEDNGEFALMDAGPPEAAEGLLSYLRNAGVASLRYVFLTHAHADHFGGLQAVVEGLPVGLVVMPDPTLGPIPTNTLYEDLLESMLKAGVSAEIAAKDAAYPLGQGQVTVLHAGLATDDDLNLTSLGLAFEAAGLRFLNTGDGEKPNEQAMLDEGAALSCDVFMAGHHGSSTSNSAAFLQAAAPRMVAVSCAAGNSYGHPHKKTMANFEAVGAVVYRTDKQGCLLFAPDGQGGIAVGMSATEPAGEPSIEPQAA